MTEKETILNLNETFYRAFQQRDLSMMNQVWWQGESFCIHPGGQVIKGWESICSSWLSIFRNTEQLEIDIEVVNLEIGADVAYVVVRETVLQSSRGRKMKAQSIATNIYQKMAQKWYLVHHHGSPIIR